MDKHFTVTIHDENGVKQFNIHKLVKKFFFWFVLFLASVGVISAGTILYLNYSVDETQKKKENIEKAYKKIEQEKQALESKVQTTQNLLRKKKAQLDELSDSLSEIEELIGLKPLEADSLQDRVNITLLNSEQHATLMQLIPSGSPIEYHGITSKFGYRTHPILHKREFHKGSDMKAKRNTPVYATADGMVEWAGYHKRSGFGNLVILVHAFGFKSYFGHLKKVVVKSGQFVKKGDLIAYTGNSGISSGPHLHYEIRFIQRPLNPFWFIKWTPKNFYQLFEKEKKVPWLAIIQAMSYIKIVPISQTQSLSKLEEKLNTNSNK
ncbi:M23 family metallopeptidase [Sulfurimonas sp.]|uniref:peptidoglycan DD-metalloendopeptidase family protein n=1 Tax=Sulfurimonas sp. TaxID=2022749 RepID=UPI002618304B|nr:M23 family metallopeptidase [Sulfurimonas sp.]